MTWVKIDDQFPDHPKVAALGKNMASAGWLHICALCYAARYLTDGLIPRAQIAKLTNLDNRVVGRLVISLIDAGLWEEKPDGYWIHDFLEYNPTREYVLAERAKTKDRVGKWRNGVSNGVTAPVTNGVINAAPVPGPVPHKEEVQPPSHPLVILAREIVRCWKPKPTDDKWMGDWTAKLGESLVKEKLYRLADMEDKYHYKDGRLALGNWLAKETPAPPKFLNLVDDDPVERDWADFLQRQAEAKA